MRAAQNGEPSDGRVIAASVEDASAFRVIFERHVDAIHRYLSRRVGWSLADDLVSETFVTAFRKRSGYRSGTPDAGPWLYGIATNLVRRHWQAEQRLLDLFARLGPEEEVLDTSEASIERLMAARQRPQLLAALADLDERFRDALLLHTWADLTYEEIAQTLDIPVGTVRSRLARARARLRESLEVAEPQHAKETP
ncbi:MAG: RNA polymerase sigma factor [Acidimicrobiales bacterium]